MGNKTSFKKGHIVSPETTAKRVASRQGYRHSEETRRKMSESQKGKKRTPEQIENHRQKMIGREPWNKGKKFSTQTRAEIHKRWLDKNHDERIIHARRWHLKNKFGITLEDYDKLLAKQNSKCAICGLVNGVKPDSRGRVTQLLHIDHCHKTNKVRGLLCRQCNVGLGSFRDSPQLLLQASEYLTKLQNAVQSDLWVINKHLVTKGEKHNGRHTDR
jgi:hypothetical protein